MSSVGHKIQLSFSGCGFFGIYHLGVVECLRRNIPNLNERIDKIYGCSAGCLVGMMLLCDKPMEDCLKIVKEVVVELSEIWGGPINYSVNITEALRLNLEKLLPDNAHQIATDKLFISCTELRCLKNKIISKFDSKQELITAMIASSYVPGYAGWQFPEYRGKYLFDGGLSNNQPRGEDAVVTVAPFAGCIDICPRPSFFALANVKVAGHVLEVSYSNIHRIMTALFPMSGDKLDELFKEGRHDCQMFLDSNQEIIQIGLPKEDGAGENSGDVNTNHVIKLNFEKQMCSRMSYYEMFQTWGKWYTQQVWETLSQPKRKVSGVTSYLSGKVSESFGAIFKLTPTNPNV